MGHAILHWYSLRVLSSQQYIFTGAVTKAYNAADFSEIDELADDEEANYRRGLKFLSQDSKGMCPCSVYSG
jgi:hypothetical protein